MSDLPRFRWATTGTRLVLGTATAVLAVVGVVVGVNVPWPTVERSPASVDVTAPPALSALACVGDVVVQGRDLVDPSALTVAALQSVVAGAAAPAPAPAALLLAAPEVIGTAGPEAFVSEPVGEERSVLAGAGSAVVSDDDLAGLAASACRPPLMESWLVAGSAVTGASDFIVLANPGTVAATVQLTVFAASGPVVPPGAEEIVVAAASQRIVPLAGLALGEDSPVVRVSATGGPVQASVQASLTRTLTPGGVDQVGPVVAPTTIQTIPGVEVTSEPGDVAASGDATVVRILSPSADASATVTARAVGSREPAVAPVTVPLVQGVPTEVDLGGLPVGTYVVEVASDAPVVAAAWQTTGFDEGADFAWHTSAPLAEGSMLLATAPDGRPVLTVVNPSDEDALVTVTAESGSGSETRTIASGQSAQIPLSPLTVYTLGVEGAAVHAAVSLSAAAGIAGYPVWPTDAATPVLTVYP
jgi:hypothetical protein